MFCIRNGHIQTFLSEGAAFGRMLFCVADFRSAKVLNDIFEFWDFFCGLTMIYNFVNDLREAVGGQYSTPHSMNTKSSKVLSNHQAEETRE